MIKTPTITSLQKQCEALAGFDTASSELHCALMVPLPLLRHLLAIAEAVHALMVAERAGDEAVRTDNGPAYVAAEKDAIRTSDRLNEAHNNAEAAGLFGEVVQ